MNTTTLWNGVVSYGTVCFWRIMSRIPRLVAVRPRKFCQSPTSVQQTFCRWPNSTDRPVKWPRRDDLRSFVVFMRPHGHRNLLIISSICRAMLLMMTYMVGRLVIKIPDCFFFFCPFCFCLELAGPAARSTAHCCALSCCSTAARSAVAACPSHSHYELACMGCVPSPVGLAWLGQLEVGVPTCRRQG